MKKAFCFILLLLLASCATRRQAENHFSASGISKETMETNSNCSEQSTGTTTGEKIEQETTNLHIIRYDTSLPADPATGKPPVKEEENWSIDRKTGEKTKAENKSNAEASTAGKTTIENQGQISADEKTDSSAEAAGGIDFVTGILIAVILFYSFTKNSFTEKCK